MDRVSRAIRSYVRLRDTIKFKRDRLLWPYFNASIPLPRRCLNMAVPGLLLGGSIELFMIHTGFYDIVTKKEAERRLAQEDPLREQHRRERRIKLAEEEKERQAAEALRAAKRQLLQPPPQNRPQQ